MSNRYAFIDMNSFFASVEQQERPELRGRPIIVAPVMADTTCAIAASYEAKAYGVFTLTSLKDARRLCPEIEVVEARPKLYREYHERIVEVMDRHFVDVKVLSVDEMACPISRFYGSRERVAEFARRIKRDLYDTIGEFMKCSIGIAPNVFLAKVATDLQKPDGLTILDESNLPDALFGLTLRDLPGIGRAMQTRLLVHGINSVRRLYACSPSELRRAWGGVTGERWYHMLRGSQEADYEATCGEVRKTVSHSHVLPPEFRTLEGVRQILQRLLSKALKRLRRYDQAASSAHLYVKFLHDSRTVKRDWEAHARLVAPANDDITWAARLRPLLDAIRAPSPGSRPLQAGIVFTGLVACADTTLSLFDGGYKRARVCRAMDELNERFGHVVDFANVYWQRQQAPYRIPLGASLLDAPVG